MSSTSEKYRSRFGFHPCDHATYLKLKFLYKHYWTTLRAFHCWHRWNRKEPQNRNGTKPSYCPQFVINRIWAKPVKRGFKLYPLTVVDHAVIERYQLARRPQSEPVEPFSTDTVIGINELYQKVKDYFGGGA